MVTAAQSVLEPTARVRAQKKFSDAALTTLEPTERVRAQQGRPNARSTRMSMGSVRAGQERSEGRHPDGAGLHLHTRTFHPPVPVPYLSLEKMPAGLDKVPGKLEHMPGRDLAFYGGLGALTVAGALEWPVALAIGGATWLLRSRRREEH